MAYLEELRSKAGIRRSFPYPDIPRVQVPVGEADPILGDANAPVTIVQFAEYQCYYCNKASPTIDALVEKYPGKVRVVFKDYPLPNHERAMPAAQAVATSSIGASVRFPWNRAISKKIQNHATKNITSEAMNSTMP